MRSTIFDFLTCGPDSIKISHLLSASRRVWRNLMLKFQTAGESHGQGLVAIISGIPAGLRIDLDFVTRDLKRRMGGYGRGGRMKIESDTAQFLSGIRHGQT